MYVIQISLNQHFYLIIMPLYRNSQTIHYNFILRTNFVFHFSIFLTTIYFYFFRNLQWLGESDLRYKMQGRLILVHLMCRDMAPVSSENILLINNETATGNLNNIL